VTKGLVFPAKHREIGICGLSCRLCPRYHTEAESRCEGCKSSSRIIVGCPFITCALKKKGLEFCWECVESKRCEKWQKHRAFSKDHDTFKCYQKLEEDIRFIEKNGISEFVKQQKLREQLLKEMLQDFNEGRSKNYYCIASTILRIDELRETLTKAKNDSKGLAIKGRSKLLHSILDNNAKQKNYFLKLRK